MHSLGKLRLFFTSTGANGFSFKALIENLPAVACDGIIVEVLPEGSSKPLEDKISSARLRAMTDDEVTSAARTDPDAKPMPAEELRSARRVPPARTFQLVRCEIGNQPDQTARAYPTAIAHDPKA